MRRRLSPCQGFSKLGKRQGYEHEGSGLFRQIVRLLGAAELGRPALVFLENVPQILGLGMDALAATLSGAELAYDLRWVVVSAERVGALHQRRRWFCLAARSDDRGRDAVRRAGALLDAGRAEPFRWDAATVSLTPRATVVDNRLRRSRIALLGNSVVPDAVRLAFDLLVRCAVTDLLGPTVSGSPPPGGGGGAYRRRGEGAAASWPSAGRWTAAAEALHCAAAATTETPQRRTPQPLPALLSRAAVGAEEDRPARKRPRRPEWEEGNLRDAPLRLDPALYVRPGYRPSPLLRPELRLTSPVRATRWATPRHGCFSASAILTRRTLRDLPTQVRFEADTPEDLRNGQLEARFVELLMGYPSALRLW